MASASQRTWEAMNNVQTVSSADEIYRFDAATHRALCDAKPWARDEHYFKHVRISALALLKMVMHARTGGRYEIMGMLKGKIAPHTMIVMDCFALPVEGTETRVNAHGQANEYMVAYHSSGEAVGRLEPMLGWYHSHPGYGCWLSGIDVGTQMEQQKFFDPFLAIVVDPVRTISAAKVEIGAFRTFPEGYKPPDEGPSEFQAIPLNKIEDFGVHCKKYYQLEISIFKSSLDAKLLDLMWNQYWTSTLSANTLLEQVEFMTGQTFDLAEKLEHSENACGRHALSDPYERKEDKLGKLGKEAGKLAVEQLNCLAGQIVKDALFNKIN